MTIAVAPRDELWTLAFRAPPGQGIVEGTKAQINLLAGTILPITEQEKKRVVRWLKETGKSIDEALAEFQLSFPPSYLVRMIADRIVWRDGKWEAVAQPAVEAIAS